jgi:hypothetical protein
MHEYTTHSRNTGRGAVLLAGASVALAAGALFGIAEPALAQGSDADAMDEIIGCRYPSLAASTSSASAQSTSSR